MAFCLEPLDIIFLIYIAFALAYTLLSYCGCCCMKMHCKRANYPAFSVETYSKILRARGYDPDSKIKGHSHTLAEVVLKRDLKEKVIWHNEFGRDFLAFLRNEHAVIAVFSGHRLHPFRKCDRIIIFISLCFFEFFFVTVFFMIFPDDFSQEFIGFLLAIIASVIDSILVAFALCEWVENCPLCCRKLCRCFGSALIINWLVLSLGFLIGGVFLLMIFWSGSLACGLFAAYVVGLLVALYLFDPILMYLDFRDRWNEVHPDDKRCGGCRCLFYPFECVFRCLCNVEFCHCCSKKKKPEEVEEGLNELGINYREYLAFANGSEIGDRPIPECMKLQILDVNLVVKEKAAPAAKPDTGATEIVQNMETQIQMSEAVTTTTTTTTTTTETNEYPGTR